MKKQLFGKNPIEMEQNYNVLKKIVESSKKLGITNIEIPLVDSSSLRNEEDKKQFVEVIKKINSIIK